MALVELEPNAKYARPIERYTVGMAKRQKLSLAPLTPNQALRALLQVKPSDVAKLEARERAKKKAGKKRRGK